MFRRRARGTEAPSDPHRAVLTVASYNIHKGQGIDGRVDLMRIAADQPAREVLLGSWAFVLVEVAVDCEAERR